MKTKLFIFLSLLSSTLIGQSVFLQNADLAYDSMSSYLINIDAYRIDESNALNRDMLQTFLFGGYITDKTKDEVRNNLDQINNYGGTLSGNVSLTKFSSNQKFGFSFGYGYRSIGSFQFSQDLYTLIFYGNQGFEERPANLRSRRLKQFNYQRFSLGMVHNDSGFSFGLGIYDSRSYSDIKIDETTVQTNFIQSDGLLIPDEINITAGEYRSEESRAGNLFESGIGIGLSGEYRYEIKEHTLVGRIEDLGAMYLN